MTNDTERGLTAVGAMVTFLAAGASIAISNALTAALSGALFGVYLMVLLKPFWDEDCAEIGHKAARIRELEARCRKLEEALRGTTEMCARYAEFIRTVPSRDIEVHPYLPSLEQAIADARALLDQANGEEG